MVEIAVKFASAGPFHYLTNPRCANSSFVIVFTNLILYEAIDQSERKGGRAIS